MIKHKPADAAVVDINAWLIKIIDGPAGLHAHEEREGVDLSEAHAVAAWVIRALANPNNLEAGRVMAAIMTQRSAKP